MISSSVKNCSTQPKKGAKRMFKPKTTISGRFGNSSGEWIRTTDLRVMSKNPKSVLFVRWVLQISQTCERWFNRARHAAVLDQCAYSTAFSGESQELIFYGKINLTSNEPCAFQGEVSVWISWELEFEPTMPVLRQCPKRCVGGI